MSNVQQIFSGADHGAVLVTTRLAKLEQLGGSLELGKVDRSQAEAVLQSWYRRAYSKMEDLRYCNDPEVETNRVVTDPTESEPLFRIIDGLQLAIAQAGAYLQESGVGLKVYLEFYEQQ